MLTVIGSKCGEHRLAAERERGSAASRGYDSRWRIIRASYLRRHPVCERPGCSDAATDVDHVDGQGPFGDNSDGNLEALCHSHHSSKTAAQTPGGWNRR